MLQIETFKEIFKHHPFQEIFKILRKVVNFRKMIHFLLFTVAKYARYNFLKEGFSCFFFHWKLIIALSFSSGFIRFSLQSDEIVEQKYFSALLQALTPLWEILSEEESWNLETRPLYVFTTVGLKNCIISGTLLSF